MRVYDTITSIEKFDQIIQSVRERRAFTIGNHLPYRQEFYRGQLDANWSIIASLARGLKTADQLRNAESAVIAHFKRLIHSKNQSDKIFLHQNPIGFQNEWLWLSQAQHLGIPTRLLDWTLHPEVALYFTVDNVAMDNVDGQFLILYVPQTMVKIDGPESRQFNNIPYQNLTETWFLNPSFFWHERYNDITGEVRRARQHGKFTLQSYDLSLSGFENQPQFSQPWDQDYDAPVIEKYIIPAENKANLREEMKARGWGGEFLYVNDDPVLNEIIAEVKKEHQALVVQANA